jgi:hypothetical protein
MSAESRSRGSLVISEEMEKVRYCYANVERYRAALSAMKDEAKAMKDEGVRRGLFLDTESVGELVAALHVKFREGHEDADDSRFACRYIAKLQKVVDVSKLLSEIEKRLSSPNMKRRLLNNDHLPIAGAVLE